MGDVDGWDPQIYIALEAQLIKQGKSKQIDRFLSVLKSHCAAGDISPLEPMLAQYIGPYVIARFREQKMILCAPVKTRGRILCSLLAAAAHLEQKERDQFAKYLEFVSAIDAARWQLRSAMRNQIRRLRGICMEDVLDWAEEIFDATAKRRAKKSSPGGVSNKLANAERDLHDLNGYLVDLSNALARVVNEISRLGLIDNKFRRLKRNERARAFEVLRRMLPVAGELNSLEWLSDEVSFGHFVVGDADDSESLFRLNFADEKLALMRRLATRRSFILKFAGVRIERFVRDQLILLQEDLLNFALEHYRKVVRLPGLRQEDIDAARENARRLLILIDAEDDLAFAASKGEPRVQAYYTAGMALTCFAVASRVVRDAKRNSGIATPILPVPLALIREIFKDHAFGAYIPEALTALSVALPARAHTRLNAKPFVRDQTDVAWPYLGGFSGMWNIMVREALLQGGQLGKDVGATWEMFVESVFKDTEWQVVGRGIKLRRNGQVVTDVDLLLLRRDLLLVVQIKALIGSADTPYDHWKNRQVIETGCRQARLATDFLAENPSSLISICGKRASNDIHFIQPVVLTNIDHLEGFSILDVPVIGEATRKAICHGSEVRYFDSAGRHVHTHIFVASDQLSTKEILRLLREPVELQIAPERPETVYQVARLGKLSIDLPEFIITSDPFLPSELPKKVSPSAACSEGGAKHTAR